MNIIKKYEKFIFIITFLIIIFFSINIKLSNVSKIYTEYDDVGVISLFKGVVGEKKINLGFFDREFNFSQNEIINFENNILYPFYIAYGWTYSPGQYIFVPFLNLDEKNYYDKIKSVRYISIFSAIISSFLIYFISSNLIGLNKWSSLMIFCIFTFSLNLNLYSNHMSPYMTYILCNILGIFICLKSIKKNNSIYLYSINSFLIYFSYLNILFYILFAYLEIRKKNLINFLNVNIKSNKLILILNILLILPILYLIYLKLQINSGSRGVSIEQSLDFIFILKTLLYQFNVSVISFQSGFIPIISNSLNLLLLFTIFLFSIIFYKKLSGTEKISLEIFIFYLIIWIVLYIFNKLPLDQTRHVLVIFPIYLLLFSSIYKKIKFNNLVSVFLIIIFIFPAIKLNRKTLDGKTSNFNFKMIEDKKIENIYTFSDTLSPFIYFKEKNIKNLDLKSFRENFDPQNTPDKILLVSQNQSINERLKYDIFFKEFINLFNVEDYKELRSDIYMTYNNYHEHSTRNGFFLYELSKKTN